MKVFFTIFFLIDLVNLFCKILKTIFLKLENLY